MGLFLIIFLNLMMVNMAPEFSNLADFSLISNSGFIMGSTPFPLYTRQYGSMETPESLLSSKLFQLVRVQSYCTQYNAYINKFTYKTFLNPTVY